MIKVLYLINNKGYPNAFHSIQNHPLNPDFEHCMEATEYVLHADHLSEVDKVKGELETTHRNAMLAGKLMADELAALKAEMTALMITANAEWAGQNVVAQRDDLQTRLTLSEKRADAFERALVEADKLYADDKERTKVIRSALTEIDKG